MTGGAELGAGPRGVTPQLRDTQGGLTSGPRGDPGLAQPGHVPCSASVFFSGQWEH